MNCLWCESPLPDGADRRPGSSQKYCSKDCRVAFHKAARIWAENQVIAGKLSIDHLRMALGKHIRL